MSQRRDPPGPWPAAPRPATWRGRPPPPVAGIRRRDRVCRRGGEGVGARPRGARSEVALAFPCLFSNTPYKPLKPVTLRSVLRSKIVQLLSLVTKDCARIGNDQEELNSRCNKQISAQLSSVASANPAGCQGRGRSVALRSSSILGSTTMSQARRGCTPLE